MAIDQLVLRAYILLNQDKIDFVYDNEKGVFRFISIYLNEQGIEAIQKLRPRTLFDERLHEEFNELDLIRNYLCKVLNSINLADDNFTKKFRNNFYLKNNKDLQNFMFRQIVRATVCIEDAQETEFFPSDLTKLILLVDQKILSNNEDFLIDAINYSTDIVCYMYQQYKHHVIDEAALISEKHIYFITNILGHNLIDDDMVKQFFASEPRIIEEEYKRFKGNKLQNALIRKVITSCSLQTIDKLISNNLFKEDELSLDVFMDSFKLFAKFLTISNKSQGINQSKQNEVFNEKHSDLKRNMMHQYRKQAFVDIEFSDPVDLEFANSSDISDDDLAPKCKSQKSQDQNIYLSNKQSHKKSRKRSTQTFNFPDLLENDYSLFSVSFSNTSIQLLKPSIIIWTDEAIDKYIKLIQATKF